MVTFRDGNVSGSQRQHCNYYEFEHANSPKAKAKKSTRIAGSASPALHYSELSQNIYIHPRLKTNIMSKK
jgi:hypothetical protein